MTNVIDNHLVSCQQKKRAHIEDWEGLEGQGLRVGPLDHLHNPEKSTTLRMMKVIGRNIDPKIEKVEISKKSRFANIAL